MLCNNHSNYRSIEKRPCEISCKEQCLLLYWNTLQHWRECLPPVECYKTVFRLNGLDFNGYFEDCKSENTKATIYTRCKQNQLKLTLLSTPSLWKSSKTGTIYQTTSVLMKSVCPTFYVRKVGIFFNHQRITEAPIRWATWRIWVFFPQENFESRKPLKSYF